MRSLVGSAEYRAATDDNVLGGATPAKLAAPSLMASQVEALTGFRWVLSDTDMLTSDLVGYLTLAGGADGYAVSERADRPTPTVLLVHERLAEAAASHAVRTAAAGAMVPMLPALDLAWRPDTDRDAMEQTLVSRPAPRPRPQRADRWAARAVEVLYTLDEDAELAWIGVVSAILRDPDALLY